jgi:hypothetical protein
LRFISTVNFAPATGRSKIGSESVWGLFATARRNEYEINSGLSWEALAGVTLIVADAEALVPSASVTLSAKLNADVVVTFGATKDA